MNLSSMSDVIFLLLIFFILMANPVSDDSMPVDQPSSVVSEIVVEPVRVIITENGDYYIDQKPITKETLKEELAAEMEKSKIKAGNPDKVVTVVIKADKSLTFDEAMQAASTAGELGAKVSFSVKPK